jgi:hypothetical protein
MRILKVFFIFIIYILSVNTTLAHKYGENDKNMFYEAFIDGYIIEMQKTIDKPDVELEKKRNLCLC